MNRLFGLRVKQPPAQLSTTDAKGFQLSLFQGVEPFQITVRV